MENYTEMVSPAGLQWVPNDTVKQRLSQGWKKYEAQAKQSEPTGKKPKKSKGMFQATEIKQFNSEG